MIFFLKTAELTSAHCSRFGPLPLPTNLDGTPPDTNQPPAREQWVPRRCGCPTAEHSERHTSQLATYTSPVQDAGQVTSTKDTGSSVQLSKGCDPAQHQGCITALLSSGDNTPTSAHGNPCEQGDNALHQDFEQLDDGDTDGKGCLTSGYSPVYSYIFFGVCYGYT